MNAQIIDKSYLLYPNQEDNIADDINAAKRYIFQIGAIEGQRDLIERIHTALKGLGLEKHSIALNVLKIAGIELPKS